MHTAPRRTVERQHFPLTSVSPECGVQPRSAVISRRPEEGETVEKFKQRAQTCTVLAHARAYAGGRAGGRVEGRH